MKTTDRRGLAAAALAALLLVPALRGAAAQEPLVIAGTAQRIAAGVHVIPDRRANLVPNIGILIGERAAMVIDTGMGPRNGETVIAEVARLTSMPVTYLTSTHYHAEHGTGAQAFPAATVIITPRAQRAELRRKGRGFIDRFIKIFGDDVRSLLDPVVLTDPDIVFDGAAEIDLGGLRVRLIHVGPAHTLGDTVIYLPGRKILFAGGLAPNRMFPIMPDTDSDGNNWISRLEWLQTLDIDIVVPGHGEIGGRELLEATRVYLEDLRAQVLAHKARGASEEDTAVALAPRVKARFADWDNPFWIAAAIRNFYLSAR